MSAHSDTAAAAALAEPDPPEQPDVDPLLPPSPLNHNRLPRKSGYWWKPGQSGNPGGKTRLEKSVRRALRERSAPLLMEIMVEAMTHPDIRVKLDAVRIYFPFLWAPMAVSLRAQVNVTAQQTAEKTLLELWEQGQTNPAVAVQAATDLLNRERERLAQAGAVDTEILPALSSGDGGEPATTDSSEADETAETSADGTDELIDGTV